MTAPFTEHSDVKGQPECDPALICRVGPMKQLRDLCDEAIVRCTDGSILQISAGFNSTRQVTSPKGLRNLWSH